MALKITDITAGASNILLTISNNGLICFGNGTPVSLVTINGIATIDSNGNITNQRAVSSSLAPTTGTIFVSPGQHVTVTTLPGVVPTVQLDSTWPNLSMTHVPASGGTPPIADHCESTPIYTSTSHTFTAVGGGTVTTAGFFNIWNVTQPSDDNFCQTGIPDAVTYRWM